MEVETNVPQISQNVYGLASSVQIRMPLKYIS